MREEQRLLDRLTLGLEGGAPPDLAERQLARALLDLAQQGAEAVSAARLRPLARHDPAQHVEAEREAIEQALLLTHWNRKHAARVLGVSYKTLLQKIREC